MHKSDVDGGPTRYALWMTEILVCIMVAKILHGIMYLIIFLTMKENRYLLKLLVSFSIQVYH